MDARLGSLGSSWKFLRWFWALSCFGRSASPSSAGNFGKGNPGTLATSFFGREKWGNQANWGSGRWGFAASNWQGFASGSTGNRAFDEWRATELSRLEEERKRFAAAEREFADYMENLRHAKDREEFERFMNQRRDRQGR